MYFLVVKRLPEGAGEGGLFRCFCMVPLIPPNDGSTHMPITMRHPYWEGNYGVIGLQFPHVYVQDPLVSLEQLIITPFPINIVMICQIWWSLIWIHFGVSHARGGQAQSVFGLRCVATRWRPCSHMLIFFLRNFGRVPSILQDRNLGHLQEKWLSSSHSLHLIFFPTIKGKNPKA